MTTTDPPKTEPLIDRVHALAHDRRALIALRKSTGDPLGAHPDAIALLGDIITRPDTENGRTAYLVAALMADELYEHIPRRNVPYSIAGAVARLPANLRDTHATTLTRAPRSALIESLPRITAALRHHRIPVPWNRLLRDLRTPDHNFATVQIRWATDIVRTPTTAKDPS